MLGLVLLDEDADCVGKFGQRVFFILSDFVEDGDGEILAADQALALVVLEQMIATQAELAGAFAGLNMMYGAVAGRTREIAALQAIGYRLRLR